MRSPSYSGVLGAIDNPLYVIFANAYRIPVFRGAPNIQQKLSATNHLNNRSFTTVFQLNQIKVLDVHAFSPLQDALWLDESLIRASWAAR